MKVKRKVKKGPVDIHHKNLFNKRMKIGNTSPAKIRFVLLISLVVLVITGLTYFYFRNAGYSFFGQRPQNTQLVLTAPSPTPSPRPIPSGSKGFTVGQADKTVPQFGKGIIDPYDPQKGQLQTVSISVKHSKPVSKVTAIIQTDHASSEPQVFKLVSGTDTDGVWQGSWPVNDTYLYVYGLILEAESNKSARVEMVLR